MNAGSPGLPLLVVLTSLHAAVAVGLWVLADLSRILGNAMKKRPLYRVYYVSLAGVVSAQALVWWGGGAAFWYLGLGALAVSMGLGVTFFYWGWLFKQKSKG